VIKAVFIIQEEKEVGAISIKHHNLDIMMSFVIEQVSRRRDNILIVSFGFTAIV